jgi:hypothetical protein
MRRQIQPCSPLRLVKTERFATLVDKVKQTPMNVLKAITRILEQFLFLYEYISRSGPRNNAVR